MLRPKLLPEILKQALSGGVEAALLVNKEGALLSSSVLHPDKLAVPVLAAIYANVWETYSHRPELSTLLCETDRGRVAISQVLSHLLPSLRSTTYDLMAKATASSSELQSLYYSHHPLHTLGNPFLAAFSVLLISSVTSQEVHD